jgi:hypothetical protein
MPAKAIMFSFCLIITILITVFMIEMVIPFARKADFNLTCSEYLSEMELMNGLPLNEKLSLIQKLTSAGYENVTVAGTNSAKKGEKLTLSVSVVLQYSGVTGIFTGGDKSVELKYEKSTVARRIYN